MRNIKILGLLVVSAMALVAVIGTASASATSFTAGDVGEALSTTTLIEDTFTITGSNVECEVNKFGGVTEGTKVGEKYHQATLTLSPSYDKCVAFGGFTAKVTTDNCHLTLDSATTETAGKGNMANVTLSNCTLERTHSGSSYKGIVIEVSVPGVATCEVIVPNQVVEHAASYATAGQAVEVTMTAEEIDMIVIKDSGLCPLTLGTHSGAGGGTYTGRTKITAASGLTYTP